MFVNSNMETFRPFSILFCILIFCSFSPIEMNTPVYQISDGWKLDKEENGIAVYTRRPANSNFDEVKVETSVKAPLSQVVAILEDLSIQKEWAYATKGNNLLDSKNVGHFEFQYFMDMPFPIKDKDVIIDFTRTQDFDSKIVTIVSKAIKHNEMISKDYVRLKDFQSIYTLENKSDGIVDITYHLNADPGSNMPAWIINLFTTTGPYKSMESLLDLIAKGKHKDTKVEGLLQ